MVVDIALALHLAAVVGYWWLTPKGFPPSSSRFWLNSILPLVLTAIAVAGLIAVHRRRWPLAAAVVLFFATAWAVGAISGRVAFPISLRAIWLSAFIVAAAGYACFWRLIQGEPRAYGLWLLNAAAGGVVGMFGIWAQTPPDASTEPMNVPPPQVAAREPQPLSRSILRPGAGFSFDAAGGELTMSAGNVQIGCLPILHFERVSADGFWSVFAPSVKAKRVLVVNEIGQTAQRVRYSDGSVVELLAPSADGSLRLTAFTPVAQDTFSHLNTYCYFQISGHKALSLAFSPCSDANIDVLPADYPSGRPMRFAYLDRSQNFYVVEATSGEKGPFRQLAGGNLERGTPLTIAVQDEGQPVAWITLEDWSRQVSTALSPTAGWKVPVNALEFQLLDDAPSASAAIWITLAATPVGRGWDTVGHRAGIYRNRVVFQTEPPKTGKIN
jgi:hypothetical protein